MKRATLILVSLGFVLGSCADAADDVAEVQCIPKKCKDLGYDCGKTPDGCGNTLNCGECTGSLTCGAVSPNKCGSGMCIPRNCRDMNASCGPAGDGCGNVISCGECPNGQTCDNINGAAVCVGATGGSGGAAGTGGSGGMGATGGIGGTGATGGSGGTCDMTDFCQQNGYGSGWYCNGNNRVSCSTQGACFKQIAHEMCPDTCEGGVCKQDCATACSGRECGSVGSCLCGTCSGSMNCNDSGKCVECLDGQTTKRPCTMSPLCGNANEKAKCVAGSWSWGQCESLTATYVGEGEKCGTGDLNTGEILCLEIPTLGSDLSTMSMTVSKVGGGTFQYSLTVIVREPSTGKKHEFNCLPIAGAHRVKVSVDMKMFSIPVGGSIQLEARTIPCSPESTYEAHSPRVRVARCNK